MHTPAPLESLLAAAEAARDFRGWVFPFDARELDAPPPWDYREEVRRVGADARTALDLGTGGGERLGGMRRVLPATLVATESWEPNLVVARDRLRPLGVHVVRYTHTHLPFRDAVFDLVLSRHEEILPAEVVRVLRPGGVFLTQQVGAGNWGEIRTHFSRATRWPDHEREYANELRAAGLEVRTQNHSQRVAYGSLAEVVFMLQAAPWEVPGFDVLDDLAALRALEAAQCGPDGLVLTEHRYLLSARMPL